MDIGENSKPKRQVVFVDPDDPDAPYWWPAMVILSLRLSSKGCSTRGFHVLSRNSIQRGSKARIRSIAGLLLWGWFLVCLPSFFHRLDGKRADLYSSLVGEHECVPFSTDTHPYIDYLKGPHGRQFHKDKAVRSATLYCSTAVPPPSFTWIRDEEAKKERIEAAAKYAGVQKSFTITSSTTTTVPSSSSISAGITSLHLLLCWLWDLVTSQAQKRNDHQHHNFVGTIISIIIINVENS